MKSRERLLDEQVERQKEEIDRLNQKITDGLIDRPRQWPIFIVRMKTNYFGQTGPTLCWPDGSTVEDQIGCEVTHSVDALVRAKVEFNVTGQLITIEEDAYVGGEKESEDAPAGEAGAGDAQEG